jgi:hypothetical protein
VARDYSVPSKYQNQLQKGTLMKTLKILLAATTISLLAGCLSVSSTGRGPQGPQGEPGTSEKVIVVPEKSY